MQKKVHVACQCVFISFFAAIMLCAQNSIAEERAPGKTFAWLERNVHFYDAARFTNAPIKEQLEAALIAGLESKGLKFVDSFDSADLELSYIAVLENAATATEIATFRTAHPDIVSLPDNPKQFEGGMLFVKLVDRDTRVKVWDNTYRGIIALDMPEEPRKVRMNELIESLISTLVP
ncbi:MAG: hypothetical protein ACU85U_12235 [Gammaproteobacteria bacterium]